VAIYPQPQPAPHKAQSPTGMLTISLMRFRTDSAHAGLAGRLPSQAPKSVQNGQFFHPLESVAALPVGRFTGPRLWGSGLDRGEAEPLQGLPRERTALIGSGLSIHTMQPQVTGPPDDLSPRPSFFSLTEGPRVLNKRDAGPPAGGRSPTACVCNPRPFSAIESTHSVNHHGEGVQYRSCGLCCHWVRPSVISNGMGHC
jgi:hypothetical protein